MPRALVVRPPVPGRGHSSDLGAADPLARVPCCIPEIRRPCRRFRQVASCSTQLPRTVVHDTEGPSGSPGRRWALRQGVPLVPTTPQTKLSGYSRHYGRGFLEPIVWPGCVVHRSRCVTFHPGQGRGRSGRRGLLASACGDAAWTRTPSTRPTLPLWPPAVSRGATDTAHRLHFGAWAPKRSGSADRGVRMRYRTLTALHVLFRVRRPLCRGASIPPPFSRLLGFLPRKTRPAVRERA